MRTPISRVAALAFALALVGCGDPAIVGTWATSKGGTVEFKTDGTCVSQQSVHGWPCSWSQRDERTFLIVEQIRGRNDNVIARVEGETLVMNFPKSGEVIRLRRLE